MSNKSIIPAGPGGDFIVSKEEGAYIMRMKHHRLQSFASLTAVSTYGMQPDKIMELARRIFEFGHQLDGNDSRYGALFASGDVNNPNRLSTVLKNAYTKNAREVLNEWEDEVEVKKLDSSRVTFNLAMLLVNIAQEAAGKAVE